MDWSSIVDKVLDAALGLAVMLIGGYAVYRLNHQRNLMKIRAQNEGYREMAEFLKASLADVLAEVSAYFEKKELREDLTRGVDDPEAVERLARIRDLLGRGGGGRERPRPPKYGIELAKAAAYLLAAIVAAAALILSR